MHIDIGFGAKVETTRSDGNSQITIEFRATKNITSTVHGVPGTYLNFQDERDAEKMAFDILHRLGHRFHDGKHTPAPINPTPPSEEPYPVQTGYDPWGKTQSGLALWLEQSHLNEFMARGELAKDLAFVLNKARQERTAPKERVPLPVVEPTEPPYKIWNDPHRPGSAILIIGSHWFHGDEARDMGFLMNKARAERLANKG